MVDRLREAVPPIDTVRRWTAPFAGTVTIDAEAALGTPADAAGGSVRVAIQNGGSELATASLSTGSASWAPATLTTSVTKGQSLYFRAGSRPKGNGDAVEWEATIAYAGGSAPDANGLNQRAYSLDDDFTLAGRPGLFTSIGEAGTLGYRVEINKTAATTDDLRPQVVRRAGAGGGTSSVAVTVTPITAAGAVDTPRVKVVTETAGQWCVDDSTTAFGCFTSEALAVAAWRPSARTRSDGSASRPARSSPPPSSTATACRRHTTPCAPASPSTARSTSRRRVHQGRDPLHPFRRRVRHHEGGLHAAPRHRRLPTDEPHRPRRRLGLDPRTDGHSEGHRHPGR